MLVKVLDTCCCNRFNCINTKKFKSFGCRCLPMLSIYIKETYEKCYNIKKKLNKMRCPYLECSLFRCDVFCSYHALLQMHFLFVVLRTITIYFSTPLISRLASIYIRTASFVITASHANFLFSLFIIRLRKLSFALYVYIYKYFFRLNEHAFCFKIGSNCGRMQYL